MARTLGLRFIKVTPGEVELEIPVADAFSFRPGQLQATPVFAAADFAAAARTLAEGGLWTWERSTATADPGVQRVELPVGDATVALPVEEVRAAIATLAGGG